MTFVLRLITFARLHRGVVMVNECVGPDGDGCTAKTVTPAKYARSHAMENVYPALFIIS